MKTFLTKLTVCAVLLSCVSFLAVAMDAAVVSVTGKVEVQKGETWVPVKAGDVLKKGDVISTGFKSSAELKMNDAQVTVGALARVTIEKLASNDVKDETSLFVDSGKISANVQRTTDKRVNFKVSSPVATASVRGTGFDFLVDELYTREGSVVFGISEQSASVVADDDVVSDYVPEEGTSSVFTPAGAISEEVGVVVYAGQASTVASTGSAAPTSPQFEQAKETAISGVVGSISSSEAEASAVAAIVTATTSAAAIQATEEASVNISVAWGD